MPTFRFRVRVNNIPRVLMHLRKVEENTLEEIGETAANYANDTAPVGTGALANSYYYEVDMDEKCVRVGSDLEYAPYVELGTGPNYEQPPDWVENEATGGYHDTDPWWYMGDDGEWHQGWFVRSQPHLRPAFLNHVKEYKGIFKKNLKNA